MPLTASVFAFGVVYGVLAHRAGLSILETALMSILVFAGSSQFVAANLFAAGAAGVQIVVAALLLNLRHLLMGLSLGRHFRATPLRRLVLLAHGITDESFALSAARFAIAPASETYLAGAGFAIFYGWLLGSLLGAVGGSFLGDLGKWGLDFAFVGAFVGLVAPQIDSLAKLSAAIVAGLAAIVASLALPGNWYVIIGPLAAVAVGMAVERE